MNIVSIDPNTFANLDNLITINLSRNRIARISRNTFHNLQGLKTLNLSYNRIVNIESQAFAYLPALEQIFLNFNQIVTLEPNSFAELRNLRRINLNQNELRNIINVSTFRGVPRLSEINLSRNPVETIRKDAFNLNHSCIIRIDDREFSIQELPLGWFVVPPCSVDVGHPGGRAARPAIRPGHNRDQLRLPPVDVAAVRPDAVVRPVDVRPIVAEAEQPVDVRQGFAAAARPVAVPEEFNDDMLEDYGEELRCKICMENKVNCIMPCGHVICTRCYQNDGYLPPPKHCPWCREAPAPDVRNLFFSGGYKEKYLKYKEKYIQLKNQL
jgi:hypothetical protein